MSGVIPTFFIALANGVFNKLGCIMLLVATTPVVFLFSVDSFDEHFCLLIGKPRSSAAMSLSWFLLVAMSMLLICCDCMKFPLLCMPPLLQLLVLLAPGDICLEVMPFLPPRNWLPKDCRLLNWESLL